MHYYTTVYQYAIPVICRLVQCKEVSGVTDDRPIDPHIDFLDTNHCTVSSNSQQPTEPNSMSKKIKPNEKCPCSSGKKYKKCCSKKDKEKKQEERVYKSNFDKDETTWENFGQTKPSLRFSIGQRVECLCVDDKGEEWTTGKIVQLDPWNERTQSFDAYEIWMDDSEQLISAATDTNNWVRPFGISMTNEGSDSTCATCAASALDVKLSNCGGCNRFKYCSLTCQKADREHHRSICHAITIEKKRMETEAKKITSTISNEDMISELVTAVERNNYSLVKRLLKRGGFDINATCENEMNTALGMASLQGYLKIMKRLILKGKEMGLDVNRAETLDGCTPLYMAAVEGHVKAVELLLSVENIDVNRPRTKTGRTPLFVAAQEGHLDVVKLLLGVKGVDVNCDNPIILAHQKGYAAIVDLFLQHDGIHLEVYYHHLSIEKHYDE